LQVLIIYIFEENPELVIAFPPLNEKNYCT